jgi:hypothetical protein
MLYLEELKDSKTYQDNPKIATAASNLCMGEFKRRLLDGQYPELVKKVWDRHVDDLEAQEQALGGSRSQFIK